MDVRRPKTICTTVVPEKKQISYLEDDKEEYLFDDHVQYVSDESGLSSEDEEEDESDFEFEDDFLNEEFDEDFVVEQYVREEQEKNQPLDFTLLLFGLMVWSLFMVGLVQATGTTHLVKEFARPILYILALPTVLMILLAIYDTYQSSQFNHKLKEKVR